MGLRRVRLDTNQTLTAAIGLSDRSGHVSIDGYNENPDVHHRFENTLDAGAVATR